MRERANDEREAKRGARLDGRAKEKGLHEQREVATQREMIEEGRGTEMQSRGGEKRAEEQKGEPMVEAVPVRC